MFIYIVSTYTEVLAVEHYSDANRLLQLEYTVHDR